MIFNNLDYNAKFNPIETLFFESKSSLPNVSESSSLHHHQQLAEPFLRDFVPSITKPAAQFDARKTRPYSVKKSQCFKFASQNVCSELICVIDNKQVKCVPCIDADLSGLFELEGEHLVGYKRNFVNVYHKMLLKLHQTSSADQFKHLQLYGRDSNGRLKTIKGFYSSLSAKSSRDQCNISIIPYVSKRVVDVKRKSFVRRIVPKLVSFDDPTFEFQSALGQPRAISHEKLKFNRSTQNMHYLGPNREVFRLRIDVIAEFYDNSMANVICMHSPSLIVRGRSRSHYQKDNQKEEKSKSFSQDFANEPLDLSMYLTDSVLDFCQSKFTRADINTGSHSPISSSNTSDSSSDSIG